MLVVDGAQRAGSGTGERPRLAKARQRGSDDETAGDPAGRDKTPAMPHRSDH